MKSQIQLAKIYGIKIGLHYSWLIIALLISLSLSQYFGEAHPDWSKTIIWTLAISSAFFFFLAIILHELSHAAVARSNGLQVSSITLFALGGVAQVEGESPDAKTEFWIGIIGPITSLCIGLVCLGSSYLLGWIPISEPDTPAIAMLVWLGYINISLAVFNMIPGFPMDGGRVLRSIIWWITGSTVRATKIASVIGQFMAFAFIMLGLILFFRGAGIGGLWIAFIGWFLLNAAKNSYTQVEFSEGLRGVTAGDLMEHNCAVLDGNTNLQTLVENHLLKTGQRCFMVTENGELLGLITPHEIKSVNKPLWSLKTVSEVMRPLSDLQVILPETSAIAALELIGSKGINQLPVVKDGKLLGIITREQIINYLFTRKELDL